MLPSVSMDVLTLVIGDCIALEHFPWRHACRPHLLQAMASAQSRHSMAGEGAHRNEVGGQDSAFHERETSVNRPKLVRTTNRWRKEAKGEDDVRCVAVVAEVPAKINGGNRFPAPAFSADTPD